MSNWWDEAEVVEPSSGSVSSSAVKEPEWWKSAPEADDAATLNTFKSQLSDHIESTAIERARKHTNESTWRMGPAGPIAGDYSKTADDDVYGAITKKLPEADPKVAATTAVKVQEFQRLAAIVSGDFEVVDKPKDNPNEVVVKHKYRSDSPGAADRALMQFRGTLTAMPADDRRLFLKVLGDYTQNRKAPDRSFTGKMGERLQRGKYGVGQNLTSAASHLAGGDLSDDALFLDQVQGIRKGGDPATSSNWLAKGALAAGEMTYPMGASLVAGAATQSAAAAVGAKGLLSTIIGGSGPATFWYAQTQPGLYSDLVTDGIDKGIANQVSSVASVPIALVEQLQVSQLMPGAVKEGAKKAVATSVAQWAKQATKAGIITYGQEMGEEAAQKGMEVAAKAAADYLDKNSQDRNWRKEWDAAVAEMGEAAVSLPFLMAPGGAVNAVGSYRDMREEQAKPTAPPQADKPGLTLPGLDLWVPANRDVAQELVTRLDQGMEISRSAWRKAGFPEGLSQKERTAQVEQMRTILAQQPPNAPAPKPSTPPPSPGAVATPTPPVSTVPPSTPRTGSADGSFKLPHDLTGAKPRYSYGSNQFELEFANDLDKSLYILAQAKPSRRDADYLQAVVSHTGMSESEARAAGADIRNKIKDIAKTSRDSTIKVPAGTYGKPAAAPTPPPTPMTGGGEPTRQDMADIAKRFEDTYGNNAPAPTQPSSDTPPTKIKYRTYENYGPAGRKAITQLAKQANIDLDSGDGETLIQFGADFYGAGRRGEPMPATNIHPEDARMFYAAGTRDGLRKGSSKSKASDSIKTSSPQGELPPPSPVTKDGQSNGQESRPEEGNQESRPDEQGQEQGQSLLAPTDNQPAGTNNAAPADPAPPRGATAKDTATPEIRKGEVGGRLSSGEVVTTSSGRQTTPFPKLSLGSDRSVANTVKKVDAWLRQNAIDEAASRGDDFNFTIFSGTDPKNLSPADKDSFDEYLFGEQPPVPRPLLKPLVPKAEPAKKPTIASLDDLGDDFAAELKADIAAKHGGDNVATKTPAEPASEPAPEVGYRVKLGPKSVRSILAKTNTIEGVRYELFRAEKAYEPSAIRVMDVDSGKLVTLEQHPDWTRAEAKYDDAVATAKRASEPAPPPAPEKKKGITKAPQGTHSQKLRDDVLADSSVRSVLAQETDDATKLATIKRVAVKKQAELVVQMAKDGMTDSQRNWVNNWNADSFSQAVLKSAERQGLLQPKSPPAPAPAPTPSPAPQTQAEKDQAAIAKLEAEVAAKAKALADKFRTKLGANPLDPELISDSVDLAITAVKLLAKQGQVKFRAYVQKMAEYFDDKTMRKAAPYLQDAWDTIRERVPSAKLDQSTDIIPILDETGATSDATDRPVQEQSDEVSPGTVQAGEGSGDARPASGESGAGVPAGADQLPIDGDQYDGRDSAGGEGLVAADERAGGAGASEGVAAPGERAGGASGSPDDNGAPGVRPEQQEAATIQPGEREVDDEDAGSRNGLSYGNYRINPEEIGKGSAAVKYRNNVAAIKLVKQMREEGRTQATRDEQDVLAKYTGWGAMSGVFNDQAEDAGDWTKQRDEMKELLTESEWTSAMESTTNAHYTSPEVVSGMWSMVQNMGFKGGRVLEPSAGVGNFIGLQPAELAGASQWSAVELDELTGSILERLYPDARTKIQGFQQFLVPDGFYDLAISNVPFSGEEKILSDRKYKKFKPAIHDYFFLKTVDKLRPGGLAVFITSTGTLDKSNADIREELAKQADLVYAVRLPEGTFGKNAGTAVVTDIVVLRKRMPGEQAGNTKWTQLATVPDPDGGAAIPINEYYANNPDQVLGTVDRKSRMYGKGQPHVSAWKDPANEKKIDQARFDQAWQQAIENAPAGVTSDPADLVRAEYRPQLLEPGDQPGQLKVVGDKLFSIGRDSRVEIPPPEPHPTHAPTTTKRNRAYARQIVMVREFEPVRQAAREIINVQLRGLPAEQRDAARKDFNDKYDRFVAAHGPFSSKAVLTSLSDDVDYDLVMSAEEWNEETETATKGAFFFRDTIRQDNHHSKAQSIEQAIALSLDGNGRLDIDAMALALDKTTDEVADELTSKGLAFEDASAGWVTADEYLSGNVRVKLIDARAAAWIDKRYERNIAALEAVQPVDRPYDEIALPRGPGAPWMPLDVLPEFGAFLFGGTPEDFDNGFIEASGEWRFGFSDAGEARHAGSAADVETWGTRDKPFEEVMDALLHGQSLTVRRKDAEGNVYVDVAATEEANAKVTELHEEFLDWVWADKDRRDRLARAYNDRHNSVSERKYNGSHLTFPGMAPPGTQMGSMVFNGLRPHQANAVWQVVVRGKGILAHEVGTGKTMTMVASAMELRRLGKARKPSIVVPDSRVEATVREARQLYPAARILTAARGMSASERRATVAKIATGDWDMVILTHENINALPVSQSLRDRYLQDQLDEIDTLLREEGVTDFSDKGLKKSGRTNRVVKRLANLRKAARERLAAATSGVRDTGVTFEETGIDFMFVDEAHAFKSLPIRTRLANVKGIPGGDAERAVNMEMIASYIQGINQGRGIVLATGTPLTNSLAELYVLQRFVQRNELQQAGLLAFDSWASTFGSITKRLDFDHAGGVSEQTRFSDFVNVKELRQMVGTDLDVVRVLDDKELASKLKRPEKIDIEVVTEASDAQADYMDQIAVRAAALKGRHDPRIDNHLKLATDGTKAALDIRLVLDVPEDANNKASAVVEKILETRKEVPDGTQMVFFEKGRSVDPEFDIGEDIIKKLEAGGIPRNRVLDFRGVSSDKKDAMIQRLRSGDAWVAIGNTKTLGTGVNAQDYIAAIHSLEPSWTPEAQEQRVGRGYRQGNRNSSGKLRSYVYLTSGSLDSWRYGVVAIKAKGFENFLLNKIESGSLTNDDAEDFSYLSYERMQALASGNPLRTEQINVQNDVETLRRASIRWDRSRTRMRSELGDYRSARSGWQDRHRARVADMEAAQAFDGSEFSMQVDGTTYTDRKEAAAALGRAARRAIRGNGYQKVGTFNGMAIEVYGTRGVETNSIDARLVGNDSYRFSGSSLSQTESSGAIQSIAYNFKQIAKGQFVTEAQDEIDTRTRSMDQIEASLRKPWRDAEKYRKKIRLLQRLNDAIARGLTKLPPETFDPAERYQSQEADLFRESFQGDPNVQFTMPGAPDVTERKLIDSLEAAFPGSVVFTKGQVDGAWIIQLANGTQFRFKIVDNIEIDWDAAEDQAGREFSDEERAEITAAGSFQMETKIDGIKGPLGLLSFAKGVADGTTPRHESIHVANQLGMFTDKEWRALVDKYSNAYESDAKQEEHIANAAEAWSGKSGITISIVDWIRRAMSQLGFNTLTADTVHRLMQKPEFWMRKPKDTGRGGTSYQLRRNAPRHDLANPGESDGVRDLVDTVDADRNDRGAPGVRKDSEVQAEAKRRLSRNYKGARKKLLDRIKSGRPLTDTETVMAKAIINRDGLKGVVEGNDAERIEAMRFIDAYRDSGAEQARAFRQRRDPVESPAEKRKRIITEALAEPSEGLRGKIEDAKASKDYAELEKLYEKAAAELKKLVAAIKAAGFDLADLEKIAKDKIKTAKTLVVIATRRASTWDMAREWWRNSVLGGVTTHAANLIGNTLYSGYHLTALRMAEATFNTTMGNKSGATFGEFRHMLNGFLPGFARGFRNALLSWHTETPVFAETIGRHDKNAPEVPNTAIPGTLGKIVRVPQRLLTLSDEFAKSMIAQIEVGSQAYRIAKSEGLSGKSMSLRIAALQADVNSPAWDAAYKTSLELTHQQEGNKSIKSIKNFAIKLRDNVEIGGINPLYFILTFVNTPINLISSGIKMSPLGSISLANKVVHAARTGNWSGVPHRVVQQIIAWGVVLMLMDQDDEDPWITGAEEASTPKKRAASDRSIPAMSIKIGDTRYSYSRIEPFATALALAVDLANAIKTGDTKRIASVPIDSILGQISEKTFLRGLSDMIDIAQSERRIEEASKWASGFAASWIPNYVRATARAFDDTVPERSVWGNGQDWWDMLGRRTLQKTEVSDEYPDVPKYDLWGRPVKSSSIGHPTGDIAWRVLLPINAKKDDVFVGDRIIAQWNRENPDDQDQKGPRLPNKYYEVNGEKKYFTEQQYGTFVKLSGELARQVVGGYKYDSDAKVPEALMDQMSSDISAARRAVKDAMLIELAGKSKGVPAIELARKELVADLRKKVAAPMPKRTAAKKDKFKERVEAWQFQRKSAAEAIKSLSAGT